MKIFKNWFVISLIASLVLVLLSLLLWGSWYLSDFTGIVVFIVVIKMNPKLRYIRAFGMVFSAFLVLNGHFFEIKGSIGDLEFVLGSHTIDRWVSVALIVLLGLLLFLDFMVREGNKKNKILIKASSSKVPYIFICVVLLTIIAISYIGKINIKDTEIIGSVINGVDSVGDINSIKVEGNGNITIIYNDNISEAKSFEEFLAPFIGDKQERIEELKSHLSDNKDLIFYKNKEINDLKEKIKETEQNVRHILEQYNGKDLSQESALYKKAFALFIDGELDKALEVLDDAELEKMAQETSKPIILKAQTLQLKHKYKKAGKYYKRAVQISPTFENHFEAAYFFQFLNSFSKAEKYYKKALPLAKDDAKRAMTLNNLGLLQSSQNDYKSALKNYEEALSIYRDLTKENPSTYLPDLATSLNNLGVLQSSQNDYKSALKNYEEALSIRRDLTKENPSTYLPYVAGTLNNLGNLQSSQNDYKSALKNYEEALSIYRDLSKENPSTYLPYVATSLNNLGNLQSSQNDYKSALKNYKEALSIRRALSKENPSTYLPYVATSLNNLGNLQSDQNDYKSALKNYEEALSIRRALSKENPSTYLPYVAMTLLNISIMYIKDTEDRELSLRYAGEALEYLYPLREEAFVQNYLEVSYNILKHWGVDPEEYLKEYIADK
ncbi:MAG: tetratricopeptide repeat protein [Hyphomicrobiales bacterium]